MSPAEFTRLVESRFAFLDSFGLRRMQTMDAASPTAWSVVYTDLRIALVVACDLRDECVEVHVVPVRNGHLQWAADGSFATGLLQHLVSRHGYRGGMPAARPVPDRAAVESGLATELARWAELVRVHAAALVAEGLTAPGPPL